MAFTLDRRHQAEERQLEMPGDVVGRLDRVVHIVERVGHRHRGDQADGERQLPRPPAGRRDRRARHFGALHDPAEVVADSTRESVAGLFVPWVVACRA